MMILSSSTPTSHYSPSVVPNKRLKLAGGDRSKGSGVLCPLAGHGLRPLLLRRRASRPQLKRDPLGRTLEPDDRQLVRHRAIARRRASPKDRFGGEVARRSGLSATEAGRSSVVRPQV